MAKVADIGGKRLISLAPDAWVQWVTGSSDVIAKEMIGADFQWVSRENDVLLKAFSPNQGEFLIANELQLRYNEKMPVRMRAYAALAEEKYGLPVYPVLVNILPPASKVQVKSSFTANVMGLQVRQDFRVINLWEVEANSVFESQLNSLLPFVPILKGGGSAEVVQRALIELRQDEDLAELESLLGFFASFVLDTSVVQQIMSWDMTVLRESPWYQEILQEGKTLGLEQGLQQGLGQGLEQGERSLILRQLTRKFGALSPDILTQIQALSLLQLEVLGDRLLDFTQKEDLLTWLAQQSS